MDLINKQYTWYYFSFTFFPPFRYFLINLLSNLLSNLSCSSRKQCQESLGSRVNDINFMKSYSMHNLFTFLYLSFWTVYKSSLRAHSIILWCTSKASTSFWNFTWSFIDCNNITCNDFLFLNCFNHFLPQIINCLHFGCF